jgi:hypothetical protein
VTSDVGVAKTMEGAVNGKSVREYLEGLGRVTNVAELDAVMAREMREALGEEREDPLLNPWKRGYKASLRSAMRR